MRLVGRWLGCGTLDRLVEAAPDSLSLANALLPNDLQQARVELLDAEPALATSYDAPQLRLETVQRREPIDDGARPPLRTRPHGRPVD
jgi:hypothetical protein